MPKAKISAEPGTTYIKKNILEHVNMLECSEEKRELFPAPLTTSPKVDKFLDNLDSTISSVTKILQSTPEKPPANWVGAIKQLITLASTQQTQYNELFKQYLNQQALYENLLKTTIISHAPTNSSPENSAISTNIQPQPVNQNTNQPPNPCKKTRQQQQPSNLIIHSDKIPPKACQTEKELNSLKTITNKQLSAIRKAKHAEFSALKDPNNNNISEVNCPTKETFLSHHKSKTNDENSIQKNENNTTQTTGTTITTTKTNPAHIWKPGKVVAVGDSLFGGLEEKKMSRDKRIKVRTFPGAKIIDMYDYIKPILRKAPYYIILHCHANSINEVNTENELQTDLLSLVGFIKAYQEHETGIIPEVILSGPILRNDSKKKRDTSLKLAQLLRNSDVHLLDNGNIEENRLSFGGLHLNTQGTRELAKNIISYVRENCN